MLGRSQLFNWRVNLGCAIVTVSVVKVDNIKILPLACFNNHQYSFEIQHKIFWSTTPHRLTFLNDCLRPQCLPFTRNNRIKTEYAECYFHLMFLPLNLFEDTFPDFLSHNVALKDFLENIPFYVASLLRCTLFTSMRSYKYRTFTHNLL